MITIDDIISLTTPSAGPFNGLSQADDDDDIKGRLLLLVLQISLPQQKLRKKKAVQYHAGTGT